MTPKFQVLVALTFISLFSLPVAFSQDPCKSYPMNGYTGRCNDLTVLITEDGKFVYTSDELTLKKWDVQTKKVVDEIDPFPYELESITDDPRFIKVRGGLKPYFDLQSRVLLDKTGHEDEVLCKKREQRLIARLKASNGMKGYERLKTIDPNLKVWFSSDSTAGVIYASATFYKIDIASGKVGQILRPNQKALFSSDFNVFVIRDAKKGFIDLVDLVTGKQRSTGLDFSLGETVSSTPDGKYLVMSNEYNHVFIDPIAAKAVTQTSAGHLKFNTDMTALFHYEMSNNGLMAKSINKITEYSYPSLEQVNYIRPEWRFKIDRIKQIHLDPDKRLFYVQYGTNLGVTPMGVYAYDFLKEIIHDSVSFVYNPTEAELAVESKERDERQRIGNQALLKLLDIRTPSYVHKLSGGITSIAGYSHGGLVATVDKRLSGSIAIVWSFPEGEPVAAYCDKNNQPHAPGNATLVEGVIERTLMSPSGTTLGFESKDEHVVNKTNVYIYREGALKSKLENHKFVALLDDHALVWSMTTEYVPEIKEMNLLNIQTGTLQKVKSEIFKGEGDCHFAKDKVFFPLEDKVGVFDLAHPEEITFYANADVEKSGYMRNMAPDPGSSLMTNRVTGEQEIIPNYNPVSDKRMQRSNFLLSAYYYDGFHIFDLHARKAITNGNLFAGWRNYNDMVYFRDLGKLLVISGVPMYTIPNAKPEDPGASAYTIDVKSGEITPYLLTESRQAYARLQKDWSQSTFTYTVSESDKCKANASLYPAGKFIYSHKGHKSMLCLGYDCDRQTYIMAWRQELYPGKNDAMASRLIEVTLEQLREGDYIAMDSEWRICPVCNGYPAGFVKEYYSGWSDWEQTSLNIYVYTRKWETKVNKMLKLCTRCKGKAWVKD